MGVGVRGHETEKVGKRQRGDEGKRDEARERERERERELVHSMHRVEGTA